jgi:hypothetical protein
MAAARSMRPGGFFVPVVGRRCSQDTLVGRICRIEAGEKATPPLPIGIINHGERLHRIQHRPHLASQVHGAEGVLAT